MKHYRIDKCTCESSYCSLNTNNFIFYHNLEFHLVTSSVCLMFDDLDGKEFLINQFLKTKQDSIYCGTDNDGRMHLDKSFMEYRLRNLNIKRMVNEVNIIYPVVARGFKCLSSPIKYYDLAIGQDTLKENYEKAEKYLSENGYNDLIDGKTGLKELYLRNCIYDGIDIEIQTVKSIDKLIKTIKDEINTGS